MCPQDCDDFALPPSAGLATDDRLRPLAEMCEAYAAAGSAVDNAAFEEAAEDCMEAYISDTQRTDTTACLRTRLVSSVDSALGRWHFDAHTEAVVSKECQLAQDADGAGGAGGGSEGGSSAGGTSAGSGGGDPADPCKDRVVMERPSGACASVLNAWQQYLVEVMDAIREQRKSPQSQHGGGRPAVRARRGHAPRSRLASHHRFAPGAIRCCGGRDFRHTDQPEQALCPGRARLLGQLRHPKPDARRSRGRAFTPMAPIPCRVILSRSIRPWHPSIRAHRSESSRLVSSKRREMQRQVAKTTAPTRSSATMAPCRERPVGSVFVAARRACRSTPRNANGASTARPTSHTPATGRRSMVW